MQASSSSRGALERRHSRCRPGQVVAQERGIITVSAKFRPIQGSAGKTSRRRSPRHSSSGSTGSSSSRRQLLAVGGALLASQSIAQAQAVTTDPTLSGPLSSRDIFPPPVFGDSLPREVVPTRVTAKGRIVAIGDLHGDWRKAIESLSAANVIRVREEDEEIVWSGGDTVVVQLGDVMDRGDHEIAIVMLLRDLHKQALEQGGAVYMLNGNHESLNICGDFRYVTPGAFVESAMYAGLAEEDLKEWDLLARIRYSVYRPGGPMAMELAKNPVVLIVNNTAFAHGGLLPAHVNYGIEKLNQETAQWIRGEHKADGGKAPPPFLAMGNADSVMWTRAQSKEKWPSPNERYGACRALSQALESVGASRLVVGHTPQMNGANCACEGQVWRMDVGMSYGVLNHPVQVLEIVRDPLTSLDTLRILDDHSFPEVDEGGSVAAAAVVA